MNNEDLQDTFQTIVARLEPDFSKQFDVIGSAETGGYLYVGLRYKKTKEVMDMRIGRREIQLVRGGKMRRQYSAVNMIEIRHLTDVMKAAS